MLLSFVKWPPSPARLAACPATLIVSCCDFKNLQTLFHPGHPPLQLTLFSSSVSTLFCICSKAASFRSFVFLHLHTLFHSFAKSDSLSPVLSVVCALFAKRRGVHPCPDFRIPSTVSLQIQSLAVLGCGSVSLIARFPVSREPDCVFYLPGESLGRKHEICPAI